jgi:hypothetical protein
LTLLLVALAAPACLSIPKVDPGEYVIDDFEDGGLTPVAAPTFGPWQCDTFSSDSPDAGGPPDSGQSVNCAIEQTGDHSCCSLAASFTLRAQQGGMDVFTSVQRGTFDAAPFKLFVFSAILELSSGFPTGTQLLVQLGCSNVPSSAAPFAEQVVPDVTIGSNWLPHPLSLAMFQQGGTSNNQACLSQIDSIRFTVSPGLANGQLFSGTLHIDNVGLE